MRAQNHRTQIHPGATARRRPDPSASSINRRSRRKPEKRGQGSHVVWLMMIIGSLVASGFLLAQRSQINAHQLRQAEETFKTQLDEMTNQQRYFALEKERVTNAQESDRIAKQANLIQPQLKKSSQSPLPSLSAKPVLLVKPVDKVRAETGKQPVKSSVKPVAQPLTPTVKKSVARVPVQSNLATLAAKPAKTLPPGKANKDSKNQRQPAPKLTQKLIQKSGQKPVQKPVQKIAQSSSPGNKEKHR